jgi:hypothetical protein
MMFVSSTNQSIAPFRGVFVGLEPHTNHCSLCKKTREICRNAVARRRLHGRGVRAFHDSGPHQSMSAITIVNWCPNDACRGSAFVQNGGKDNVTTEPNSRASRRTLISWSARKLLIGCFLRLSIRGLIYTLTDRFVKKTTPWLPLFGPEKTG